MPSISRSWVFNLPRSLNGWTAWCNMAFDLFQSDLCFSSILTASNQYCNWQWAHSVFFSLPFPNRYNYDSIIRKSFAYHSTIQSSQRYHRNTLWTFADWENGNWPQRPLLESTIHFSLRTRCQSLNISVYIYWGIYLLVHGIVSNSETLIHLQCHLRHSFVECLLYLMPVAS